MTCLAGAEEDAIHIGCIFSGVDLGLQNPILKSCQKEGFLSTPEVCSSTIQMARTTAGLRMPSNMTAVSIDG